MSSHQRTSVLARAASVALSPTVIDVAIALGLAFACLFVRAGVGWERTATVLLVAFPLAVRSRLPLAVLAVTVLGTLITQSAGGWICILAVAIASFSTGDLSANRFLSTFGMLAVAAAAAGILAATTTDPALSLSVPFVVIVPAWVLGVALRTWRLEAEGRASERERADRERLAVAQSALAEERRHIARELHDVVAHGVSVMLIQTGAARIVLRTSPDEAEQSLLAAEAAGRDAMAELRRLLGVLADEGEAASRAPQSGVAQLESLVERVREAGLPADLRVEGQPRPLASGVDVALYRIAQEALTNALRHAGRAPTHVRLAYGPSEVELEVLDEGTGDASAGYEAGTTPDGAGRGLIGMRQRAALFGGRLEAGPALGRGYAVRAWLPTDQTALAIESMT